MLITDVFETMKAAGKWFDLSKANLQGDPAYPYVARSGGDNGIGSMIPEQGVPPPNEGNCLTIGVSTSTVFYQPVRFYTSKEIQVLRHPRLTAHSGLVLVAVLREQMVKFQWGNGASLARLAATRIMVPVTMNEDGNDVPDWDGMERLGRELTADARAKAAAARPKAVAAPVAPPALTFAPMLITDVFETMRASQAWYDKNKVKKSDGQYSYVSRSGSTNGLEGVIGKQDRDPNAGNAITIGVDTQTVFYQPMPFYTSVKIQVLRHPQMTAFSGLVLVTILRAQMSKFQWGNGASLVRLAATRIMVPVTTNDDGDDVVDWDGIDQYGRWLAAQVDHRASQVLGEALC